MGWEHCVYSRIVDCAYWAMCLLVLVSVAQSGTADVEPLVSIRKNAHPEYWVLIVFEGQRHIGSCNSMTA